MNGTRAGAIELARAIAGHVDALGCEVVVFPPYPHLVDVIAALAGGSVAVGAQDVSARRPGAFTGQVSAEMIVDLGASWTIIGHSERRHGAGDTDQLCGEKVVRALEVGLRIVLCVGETWEERNAGRAPEVNRRQLGAALDGVSGAQLDGMVIAYEPVWAIGTGKTASAEDAQEAHGSIRDFLASRYDPAAVERVRILYGGSVNAGNAGTLFAQRDVDGGLIGGASLKATDFLTIVSSAQPIARTRA